MASRTTPGPATLRLLDAGIGCFREGGFSVEGAAHAISVVDSYVHGFVLQEVNLPFRNEAELTAMTGAIMLIADVLFGGIATVVFSLAAAAMFTVLWGLLPLRRRLSLSARQPGDPGD